MDNWGVTGHNQIIKFLQQSLDSHKLAQAYLFYGPPNLGKTKVAEAFAERLLGQGLMQAVDFYKLECLPDKKDISIEQVRDWRRSLTLKGFNDAIKVGIIYEAERLNNESSSALLKTLEEPTSKTVIIILTSDRQALLSTIASRSQLIKFAPLPLPDLYKFIVQKTGDPAKAKQIIGLSGGRTGLAVQMCEDEDLLKEYLDQQTALGEMFNLDLNGRIRYLESFLAKHEEAPAKLESARLLIAQAEILFRFLLLNNYQLSHLAHLSFTPPNLGVSKVLDLLALLKKSKEQLSFNVSPRLILENIFINI
ncbi:MAG: AAA family ATPase [Patescibacteria group bacterium]|jgi:DNA polymerase-3 subunit delta'